MAPMSMTRAESLESVSLFPEVCIYGKLVLGARARDSHGTVMQEAGILNLRQSLLLLYPLIEIRFMHKGKKNITYCFHYYYYGF